MGGRAGKSLAGTPTKYRALLRNDALSRIAPQLAVDAVAQERSCRYPKNRKRRLPSVQELLVVREDGSAGEGGRRRWLSTTAWAM